MRAETLDAILAARAARASVVRIVSLATGREFLVSSAADLEDLAVRESGRLSTRGSTHASTRESESRLLELAPAVDEVLRADRGRLVEIAGASEGEPDEPWFIQPFSAPVRLAIVGAVHIAQRLAVLARDLGYDVLVIDPRRGFLTEARFPGAALSHAWPDAALEAFGLDARSALVTLSHDPKIDNSALEAGLRSNCFYIGALGSQRTQARRRERLREAGFDDATLARIHGPVGLDLGARSPAEIALSIAAELTVCLRKGA